MNANNSVGGHHPSSSSGDTGGVEGEGLSVQTRAEQTYVRAARATDRPPGDGPRERATGSPGTDRLGADGQWHGPGLWSGVARARARARAQGRTQVEWVEGERTPREGEPRELAALTEARDLVAQRRRAVEEADAHCAGRTDALAERTRKIVRDELREAERALARLEGGGGGGVGGGVSGMQSASEGASDPASSIPHTPSPTPSSSTPPSPTTPSSIPADIVFPWQRYSKPWDQTEAGKKCLAERQARAAAAAQERAMLLARLSPAGRSAADLLDRGFSVVPVRYKQKYPEGGKGWTELRLKHDELPARFPHGRNVNVGIMLGSASMRRVPGDHALVLVDVDIDCDELLATADQHLPATGAIFGRASRPRSHRLYWCAPPSGHAGSGGDGGVRTERWQCPVRGVLAELRAEGSQTVAPGSIHPSGEAVRWEEGFDGEPAVVAHDDLVRAISALCGRGAGQARVGTPKAIGRATHEFETVRSAPRGNRNNTLYLAALRVGSMVGSGSLDATWASRALVAAGTECGLSPEEAQATVENGMRIGQGSPDGAPPQRGGWFREEWGLPTDSGGTGGGGGAPPPLTTLAFDQVEPRTLRWLWPGVLPLGKLCCLCGDPGLGKSFVTLDLAARLSRGELLDNQPADTLLLNAEDDPADTVAPRLLAAGADMTRVRMLCDAANPTAGEETEGVRTEDGGPAPSASSFLLDRADALDTALEKMPQCRLVIIDPVTAYFPERLDPHRQTDVRRLLRPLAAIAQRREVTILLVAHLNKNTEAPEVHRVSGSMALPAACRAVWLVRRDSDDPAARVMSPVKLNLAPDLEQRRYRLRAQAEGAPRLVWEQAAAVLAAA